MSSSGQSPEIVAAARLSPLSPVPISISVQDHDAVVAVLQNQAATTDTTTMAESIPDTGAISDTIVVAGDEYSDETHDESLTDGSIYGEEEDPEARAQPAAATASPAAEATAPTDSIPKAEAEAQAEAEDNDYAKSFDSPPRHQSPKETEEAHPDDDDDVSPPPTAETSESIMNTSQSHPHPRSAVTKSPSPPPGLPLTNGSAPGPVPDSTATVLESKSLPLPPSSPSSPINATANAPTAAPSEELIRALVASASATAAAAAAASSGADTTPNKVTAATAPALSDIEDDGAVDIQKLVDDITRRASSTAASSPSNPSAVTTATTNLPAPPTTTSAPALPASLPPKPSLPKIPPQPHAFHSAATIPIASPTTPHGNYMSASAPGTGNDPISSLPAPPHTAYANQPHGQSHAQSTVQNSYNMNGPPDAFHNASNQRAWETFLADENRYTSEQNWDRFPEGSRIFIGNLSSDRVSKREVFTYFSRFGRLAQISLKSAYGFVQYHTIAEGQACLQGAQGIEMGGRKIHLEISRAQKKKDKEDREKPPDRQNFHGARERFDNRNQGHASGQGWKRDDYRPAGRSPSPRRYDGRGSRDGFYPRERGFGSMSGTHDRRRSQSPARHNRQGNDYRRRSPSPHRRTSSPALDLPRRYGQDVPDVQIILLQEVSRGFVTWVQGSLHNRGLRTDVMYLNPRFPRQMVVERQALEGVHAIIDLDYATEAQGKINMQLFIRAPGTTIRFEEYRAIDPPIAAELVLREKTKPFHSQPQQQPGGPVYPPQNNNGYGPHYPTEAPAVPAPYQQYPQTAAAPLPPHATPAPGASAPDLSTLIGQFNNNALQSLLATLQPQQQQQQSHYGMAPAVLTPQVGVNAILSNLQNAQLPTQPNVYGGGPQMAAYAGGGNNPVDAAQHVQSILKNLKRSAD